MLLSPTRTVCSPFLNDITDGMNQIKDLEKILTTTNVGAESQSRKDQIRNDIVAIQQALKERRERLDDLEQKLKSSQGYSSTLKKTVDNLKAEIASQETTISTLRNDLAAAKIQIADLGTKVDSLSTTVATVTEGEGKAQEESVNLTNELNSCYYAIGTKGELKDARIIETVPAQDQVAPGRLPAELLHSRATSALSLQSPLTPRKQRF